MAYPAALTDVYALLTSWLIVFIIVTIFVVVTAVAIADAALTLAVDDFFPWLHPISLVNVDLPSLLFLVFLPCFRPSE